MHGCFAASFDGSYAHAILKDIARDERVSMQTVLDKMLMRLHRTNEAFQALRGNPEAWRDEQEEREVWDRVLADAQHDDPETK